MKSLNVGLHHDVNIDHLNSKGADRKRFRRWLLLAGFSSMILSPFSYAADYTATGTIDYDPFVTAGECEASLDTYDKGTALEFSNISLGADNLSEDVRLLFSFPNMNATPFDLNTCDYYIALDEAIYAGGSDSDITETFPDIEYIGSPSTYANVTFVLNTPPTDYTISTAVTLNFELKAREK